jgi:hypothetical protein
MPAQLSVSLSCQTVRAVRLDVAVDRTERAAVFSQAGSREPNQADTGTLWSIAGKHADTGR